MKPVGRKRRIRPAIPRTINHSEPAVAAPSHPKAIQPRRRPWRLLVAAITFFVLSGLAWYGLTLYTALNKATSGAVASSHKNVVKSVKAQDSDPVNILLIGVGGENHSGGLLADSIMIASIDPKTSTVSLLSVPRDLYVSIPGYGKQKINAADVYGEKSTGPKGGGAVLLQEVLSTTLDIPIHYYVRVDFTGFKKIIDAIGGVDVTVEKAINDPFYPDDKTFGYKPFYISAGDHHLDGATALKYARSRETTTDFDRARRQQQIISAVRGKIFTADVLANPAKTTNLIQLIGSNVLTDMKADEIVQLGLLMKDVDGLKIQSQVIDNSTTQLLMDSQSSAGAYILVPRQAGGGFNDIQTFAHAYFASSRIQAENTKITIITSGGTSSQTGAVKQQLERAGFVVEVADGKAVGWPSSDKTSQLIRLTKTKKVSDKFLTDSYALPVKSTVSESIELETEPDYVMVIGSDFSKLVYKSVKTLPTPGASTR